MSEAQNSATGNAETTATTATQAAAGNAGAGQQAAAAQAAATAAGGNAQASEAKWYAGLNPSKEAAEYIEGKGFKNFDDVTKSYRELEGKITAKGLLIPKDDAPASEWQAFYRAQGAPESADKYELAMPPGVEPSEIDKQFQTEMRKAFHEAGLTPKQVARLNNGYNGVYAKVIDNVKALQAAEQKAGETAIEEWEGTIRKNGGDPTKAKALAQTAAQTIIPKDSPLYAQIEKALGLDGKPGSGAAAMVDLFHRIGTMMSEGGGALRAGGQAGHGALTGPQAQIELNRMNADPNVGKILADPRHPQFTATKQRWNDLIDTITKEEQAKRAA